MHKHPLDPGDDYPDTTLTKRELAIRIAQETGITQTDIAAIIQLTLDHIVNALASGRHVEFREFGVFEVVERKPRVGRNPLHPEQTVQIPSRKTVKFKPGKRMRQLVEAI